MNTTSPKSLLRKIMVGLLFGFLVFLALALIGDLRLVSQQMVSFRWSAFLLALGFTLFNYTLRSLNGISISSKLASMIYPSRAAPFVCGRFSSGCDSRQGWRGLEGGLDQSGQRYPGRQGYIRCCC